MNRRTFLGSVSALIGLFLIDPFFVLKSHATVSNKASMQSIGDMYYVSNDGYDRAGFGLSADKPCRTIGYALSHGAQRIILFITSHNENKLDTDA